MKKILLFAIVICLVQAACQPEAAGPVPVSLDGTWRMIMVKDNGSGITTRKPSSVQRDVDITFTSTSASVGSFKGNTPTNNIDRGDYTLGANQTITIPVMSMTKVGETSWGSLFVDHIRSSESYSFENGGILTIRTTKMVLTFQKL